MHFKDLRKGDRVFESAFGRSVEIEVITNPRLHKDHDTWTFKGKFRGKVIEYMMSDKNTAYAPKLSPIPQYFHVEYLDGTKEGI